MIVQTAAERLFGRLLRVPRTRGFGIQSPFAYGFVRYVVAETLPYYAYDDLRAAYPAIPKDDRRRLELYLRIANYVQATECLDLAENEEWFRAYVGAGCKKTVVSQDARQPRLLRMQTGPEQDRDLKRCLDAAGNDALLIVEGIRRDERARALWQRLCQSPRTGTAFDLYDCGLVFLDTWKVKACYKVNY